MKVIVVDDENDALINFLTSIVDDAFLEYKMFRNACLAAEYLRKNHADAAFLDINMPHINGVDLAEQLISISPKIKIVFISGYTQNEKDIKKRLGDNLKGFCYKPYDEDTLFRYLKQIESESGYGRKVFIRTFGTFDLFIDNKPIKFSSTKSKELLALLVDKNGASLTMGETLSFLWADKNTDLSKSLYRDAVWRLRQTLDDFGLGGLVSFSRALCQINKDNVSCDYWDFLQNIGKEKYAGVYMPSYDWSIETQSQLDIIKDNN